MNKLTEFLSAALGDPNGYGILYFIWQKNHMFTVYNIDRVMKYLNEHDNGEKILIGDLYCAFIDSEARVSHVECADDGEVKFADAFVSGYGPYAYYAAMKLMPNGICPDQIRGELSRDAKKFWTDLYTRTKTDSNIVMSKIADERYKSQPYRNYFYKINGGCIADPLLRANDKVVKEVCKDCKTISGGYYE